MRTYALRARPLLLALSLSPRTTRILLSAPAPPMSEPPMVTLASLPSLLISPEPDPDPKH